MRVLIITGGTSSERRISLMSAKQVKKGLAEIGHSVKLFDLKKGFKELKKISKNFDVIFPVLHGEEGEGGGLQKFLSNLGISFVGGKWQGYKKGWYKIPFKKFCEDLNIPTAAWKIVKTKKEIQEFGFPSVLKSSSGGSSREVVILKTVSDLKSSLINKLLKSKLPLLVEKYLEGVEITVAILQNYALPIIEIVPPKGGWFDYQNKYSGVTQEIPHAPSVSKKIQQQAQKIALKIHKTLNLGQFSRIDFIVYNGTPYVLEINTIPGLTAASLFPKAAQAIGITFPKLLDKIIKLALK
ncbi:ATP-grasp domain-containing protein [Candidatus Daviesbacteria bacterium]|nr:ATP-grasp domain-containing protein [Candidatus Daviesbacteria bacterium]